MNKKSIAFVLISSLIGLAFFYLLKQFIFTDTNLQRLFLSVNPKDIFIPNYSFHFLLTLGILFISIFIALYSYQKFSLNGGQVTSRINMIFLFSGLGCLLIYVSVPFTVFRSESVVYEGLFSKKLELSYSDIESAFIYSHIEYYNSQRSGGCSLEHGITIPNFIDKEIILRGKDHQKISAIKDIFESHKIAIESTSTIEEGCERMNNIEEIKNKIKIDLD